MNAISVNLSAGKTKAGFVVGRRLGYAVVMAAVAFWFTPERRHGAEWLN
jgi:hypothetical protein